MELVLQSIANALVQSGFFSLWAVGLVLIFGVMGIINFAHGEMVMVGAYTVWLLYAGQGLPFPLALLAAALIVCLLGLCMERFLFQPFRENPLGGLINSIGLLFILQVLAVQIGGLGLMKHVPPAFPGTLELPFEVRIPVQRAVALVVSLGLLAAVGWLLTWTRLGWALRAVSMDREAAALQGISVRRIGMFAMGLGAALAGTAGALMAPLVRVEPYMGHAVIITAFIVAIVGGIGSIRGAVLAAVLYAFFHTFVTTYYSGTLATMLGLFIMLLVLVIKPTGLMGSRLRE